MYRGRAQLFVSLTLLQAGLCFAAPAQDGTHDAAQDATRDGPQDGTHDGLTPRGTQNGAQDRLTQDATYDPTQNATHDNGPQLTVLSGSAFRVEVLHRTRLQKGRLHPGPSA